jgi:anti-sigma-K factor RskA
MAMSHSELRDLSGLYALGMLTGEERREFEAHLESCQSCVAEVRQAREAVDALGASVPQVEPPASLRARVLASAERQGNVAAPEEPSVTATASPTIPASRARMSWRQSVPYGLAAAASLAAVALGMYALTLRERLAVLEGELQSTRAAQRTLQRQLVTLRADADIGRRSAFILAATDLRRIELGGQAPAVDASARAFWSPARGVIFAGTRLPALPQGRVYQLWMVTESAPVSVGLLTPDAQGKSIAVAPAPAVTGRVVALAVTLEPAGGVPAPTGPKILVGLL